MLIRRIKAISRLLLVAVLVVIIVAVAAASAVIATRSPSSSTSSSVSSSSSTSSSSLQSTSTSSSTTSSLAQSTSCTSTSISSTQPASVIIPLLNAYSNVTQTFQGTLNGTIYNFTASYALINVNSTTYQVNVVDITPTQTYSTTVWLLKDGTVVALDLAGHNFTGASASTHFQTYFSPWENDVNFGQQIVTYSSSSYFRYTGSSTVTLGPSTFNVKSYVPNTLPETVPGCSGASITLTAGGNFSVGTPSGSSYPLVTNLYAVGSGTIIGSLGAPVTTTYNFTSEITSVTVA